MEKATWLQILTNQSFSFVDTMATDIYSLFCFSQVLPRQMWEELLALLGCAVFIEIVDEFLL